MCMYIYIYDIFVDVWRMWDALGVQEGFFSRLTPEARRLAPPCLSPRWNPSGARFDPQS